MRDNIREQLTTEITRKQFLQYTAGALLMVFGLNNLVALLTGTKLERHALIAHEGDSAQRDGFGTRKFGV